MHQRRIAGDWHWRILFALAAIYNIGFGAWAILFPHAFFEWFDLGVSPHPWAWSCLGMVIGIYGLGYAHIAWKPADGDVFAALGLLGKILGPLGWLLAVRSNEIPPSTFLLILFNDVVWWYPFLAYLLRRSQKARTNIGLLMVAFHTAACFALLFARAGTEAEPDVQQRIDFVAQSTFLWTACWFLWTAASIGLLAFFVAWALTLREAGASTIWMVIGCCLCAIGLAFDLTSEVMLLVQLPQATSPESFHASASRAAFLGAGMANGLYCIGGIVMSCVSWAVGFQRGAKAMLAATVWVVGLGLSVSTFAGHATWMTMTGAALMITFLPWAALTSIQFKRNRSR